MHNKLARDYNFLSLLKFSIPTIIMMVFMSLYTMVDGIFVSRLIGTNALAAVNIVYPILSIVIAMGVMLGTGGSAIVASKMGEGKFAEARQDFTFLTIVGIIIGLVITIIGLFFLEPILRFLGASTEIYQYCYEYARPLVFFAVPGILQMLFQMFFVAAGKPALGLTVTILGGAANIVLDYVFIAVFDWGIRGAAVATGIGYCIPGGLGLIWFLIDRKNYLHFVKPAANPKVLLHTLTNGSSEMVANLSAAIITYLFNIIMMHYLGEDGVAAITIVLYAEYLLIAIYLGYSSGVAPILSYNHGEGNIPRLKKLFKMSIGSMLGTSVLTFIGALLFAGPLVRIFAPSGTPVYAMAVHGFHLYAASYLFKGVNIFASSMFTALNDGKTSAMLSFMRTLVFIVLGFITLPYLLEVNGVWLAVPFAEFLSILLSAYCLRRQLKTKWRETSKDHLEIKKHKEILESQ